MSVERALFGASEPGTVELKDYVGSPSTVLIKKPHAPHLPSWLKHKSKAAAAPAEEEPAAEAPAAAPAAEGSG
jgi:hypothetical protein